MKPDIKIDTIGRMIKPFRSLLIVSFCMASIGCGDSASECQKAVRDAMQTICKLEQGKTPGIAYCSPDGKLLASNIADETRSIAVLECESRTPGLWGKLLVKNKQ